MNAQDTNRANASYDQVVACHQSLSQLVDEICGTKHIETLVPMLNQLRLELQEHFEQEEGPGGFGMAVGDAAPHLTEQVNKLFEEHPGFLKELHRLQDAAQACLKGPMAEVQASAKELCQRIRDHEAAENELLTDAMNTDFGGRG